MSCNKIELTTSYKERDWFATNITYITNIRQCIYVNYDSRIVEIIKCKYSAALSIMSCYFILT